MSVNKLGSPLTPYLKTSSIFEGHPGANLATVARLGVVHSGNMKLGVYSDIFAAYADGVRPGQLYLLGGIFPTGLITEDAGPEGPPPELPPEAEHFPGIMEEVKEKVEDPEIPEPKEEEYPGHEGEVVIPEEGEVGITANAEPVVLAADCELMTFGPPRIFSLYELRLCEAQALIGTIAGQEADVVAKVKDLTIIKKSEQDKLDETKAQVEALTTEHDEKKAELAELKATYTELLEACAKASSEGPAGNEHCAQLKQFIDKGQVNNISKLESQIAQLEAQIAVLQAEVSKLEQSIQDLAKTTTELSKRAEDLASRGILQEKTVSEALEKYGKIGEGVAPSIGNMNKIAVGLSTISGACGAEAQCCPLPPGEEGDIARFNLEFLAKFMSGELGAKSGIKEA
tara:strand:+ start:212 stop:1411 length:1200 start_codon:yes stop_codon:yes gene_type:complete